jgi:hypothetical protein
MSVRACIGGRGAGSCPLLSGARELYLPSGVSCVVASLVVPSHPRCDLHSIPRCIVHMPTPLPCQFAPLFSYPTANGIPRAFHYAQEGDSLGS